jgi:hypothetical protein
MPNSEFSTELLSKDKIVSSTMEQILHTVGSKNIQEIELIDDRYENSLIFLFNDSYLRLFDNCQICCEHRYITINDDLSYYVGSSLIGFDVKEVETSINKDDCHEQVFVDVITSKGAFTICSHNIHNGYYGGFTLKLDYVTFKDNDLNGEVEQVMRFSVPEKQVSDTKWSH